MPPKYAGDFARPLSERFADRRQRNLTAFEEHIQTHGSSCFFAEQPFYTYSRLG